MISRRFLQAAHDRGLRVVIELVLNHTSDQHPWFQRARSAPPGSPERDYYVWSDTDQTYQRRAHHLRRHRALELDVGSGRAGVLLAPVLSASAGSELRQSGGRPRDAGGPRLLARSGRRRLPARRRAVPGRARWHELREPARDARASSRRSARISMRGLPAGCCWPRRTSCRPTCAPTSATATNATWPITSRSCRASSWRCTWRIGSRSPRSWSGRPPIPDSCQWALFLRNHDELTLEMVTDDERDYMYLAYSMDPQARLNLGIRRRLAPLVGNSRPPDRAAGRPALLVSRHADHLLRRRNRHGRQPLSRRPQRRPHADAVDRRSQCAASRAPIRRGCTARSSWIRCTGTRP